MSTHTQIELQTLRPEDVTSTKSISRASIEGRVLGHSRVEDENESLQPTVLTRTRSNIVIIQLVGIEFLASFNNGTLTVGLPTIAAALSLHEDLLIWPNSVFYLTCGTCLLVAGSVADVVGPRKVALTGGLMLAIFVLACGFAQTAIQIIMFRAMAGIAYALISPTSVSLISTSVKPGTRRNVAFASIGVGKVLGFSSGLVLGGVFVASTGWRTGYYIAGALGILLFLVGIWALPQDKMPGEVLIWKRLASEIDWPGALLASTGLATLSYVLAMLSANVQNVKAAANITLLVISLVSFVAFIAWMQWQETRGKPALIPNSLWRNASFTSVCLMIMLCNAICDSMELFCSLFFQEVQGISALGTSLRILPSLIVGAILNFTTGFFVNRVPVLWAVLISSGLCAVGPLLMAVIQPASPYWYNAFFAQLLLPLSADVLFTVGLLVVSDSFPIRTQALAGAVFNTFSQLGISIGLTTMSIISSAVTSGTSYEMKASPEALLVGYRASFWTMFAWMITACLIGIAGLRNVGKIGVKRD